MKHQIQGDSQVKTNNLLKSHPQNACDINHPLCSKNWRIPAIVSKALRSGSSNIGLKKWMS